MPIHPIIYEYISDEETYSKNSVIIQEGKYGNWVYVLLKGQAKIIKTMPEGRMTMVVLKEGDIFGEINLLLKEDLARTTSVIADTDVKVGVLNTERLSIELETISPQLRRLIMTLVKRLRSATETVAAS